MSRTTVTISAASKIVWEKLKKKFSAKSADALILEFEKRLLGVLAPQKDAAENLDSEEEVQGPEKRREKMFAIPSSLSKSWKIGPKCWNSILDMTGNASSCSPIVSLRFLSHFFSFFFLFPSFTRISVTFETQLTLHYVGSSSRPECTAQKQRRFPES
jgi:hypothetical protein